MLSVSQAIAQRFCGFVLLPKKQDLIFKLNTMKTDTKQSSNLAECGNKSKPLLANRLFEFRGISKSNNEVIYGNYYFDGNYHFIDKCFEHRKEVYAKSVSQFTGLISLKQEKAFYGDVISFQTTEGKELTKELWFCTDKQSLMVGTFTYYELAQSGFIQPTKLEFEILPQTT